MRARSIKPGFYKNEELAECSFSARLLFPGLWMIADREGRLEYRPKRIKAEIFPYDNIDIEPFLEELERNGLIKIYTVDGNSYIYIPKFLEHQRPHQNEQESVFPAYQGQSEQEQVSPLDVNCCDQGDKDLLPKKQALRPSSLNPSSLNPEVREYSSLRSEYLSTPLEADADGVVKVEPQGEEEQARENQDDTPEQQPRLTGKKIKSICPPCPHKQLIELYHEKLPAFPAVKTMNPTREGYARGRWRETWDRLRKEGNPHDTSSLLDYFGRYFAYVGQSDFLSGRITPRNGTVFQADFEWLLRPCNFAKVIEKFYHRRAA